MPHEPEESLTRSEREVEQALRGLRPVAPGVDPITLAFAAGAASARGGVWMWRSAAAVLCVALGISIVARSGQPERSDPTPGRTMIVRETTSPSTTIAHVAEFRSTGAYVRLRDRVLTQGFDAPLGDPVHAPAAPATPRPIPRAVDGDDWRPL